ncbi:hypothetical protein BKA66DRAFT_577228 [Pyrenochaeta sp. MPI-SDFR-AT-0127]|nr:hypothetical protein BKA66DRAFT_577228 [Pyrenochaeta sp. MPI-SDFR-AT-0127]
MPQFRYSGVVPPEDELHQIIEAPAPGKFGDTHSIAPTQVPVTITNPGPTRQILVPQYGPNVTGTAGYNPAKDCGGNFMSSKFQPNNNCYAYGCDFASNSFAQPGRMHGNLITASTLNGPSVQEFAEKDGLINVGTTIDQVKAFATKRQAEKGTAGHFVALMISLAEKSWSGDYHWARCDDPVNFASWSQKDGGDSVTNFDFAGNPITDPSKANWAVNQGPQSDKTDMIIEYKFFTFMFVPHGIVSIV